MSISQIVRNLDHIGSGMEAVEKKRDVIDRLFSLWYLNGIEAFSVSQEIQDIVEGIDTGISFLEEYQKMLLYNVLGSHAAIKNFFAQGSFRHDFLWAIFHSRAETEFFACTLKEYFIQVINFVESQATGNMAEGLSLYIEIMWELEGNGYLLLDGIKKETKVVQDTCSENEEYNFDILSGRSKNYVLVRLRGQIIWHIKLSGEDTFFSYVNSANSLGELQLISWGIYSLDAWADITRPKYKELDSVTYIYDADELDINFLRMTRIPRWKELVDDFLTQVLTRKSLSANPLIEKQKAAIRQPELFWYYDL